MFPSASSTLFLAALLAELLTSNNVITGHKVMDFEVAELFAAKQGLLVSFEHPVYSNGYFLGFEVRIRYHYYFS